MDDFYEAKQIVALFSREPGDSWVLPELNAGAIPSQNKKMLLFATNRLRAEDMTPIRDAVIVAGPKEFKVKLRASLEEAL